MQIRVILFISFLCFSASNLAQKNSRILGFKSYEVSNHLGNVMAVVSDRKTQILETQNTTIAFNETNIKAYNDYYPYGMLLDGRVSNSRYRFGLNGMEMDNDIKGNGNSYTTEFRQYDPRSIRWISVDPKGINFPNLTPYVANNNNPIYYIDKKGDVPIPLIFGIVALVEGIVTAVTVETVVVTSAMTVAGCYAYDEIKNSQNSYMEIEYSTGGSRPTFGDLQGGILSKKKVEATLIENMYRMGKGPGGSGGGNNGPSNWKQKAFAWSVISVIGYGYINNAFVPKYYQKENEKQWLDENEKKEISEWLEVQTNSKEAVISDNVSISANQTKVPQKKHTNLRRVTWTVKVDGESVIKGSTDIIHKDDAKKYYRSLRKKFIDQGYRVKRKGYHFTFSIETNSD